MILTDPKSMRNAVQNPLAQVETGRDDENAGLVSACPRHRYDACSTLHVPKLSDCAAPAVYRARRAAAKGMDWA
jgi:hypothetical protein